MKVQKNYKNNIQKNIDNNKNTKEKTKSVKNKELISFSGAMSMRNIALAKTNVKQAIGTPITEEDIQDIYRIANEKRPNLDESEIKFYFIDRIETKEQAELAKLLIGKRHSQSHYPYYNERFAKTILEDAKDLDVCTTAIDMIENFERVLDEDIFKDLTEIRKISQEKYNYIKSSDFLLDYENEAVSALNGTKNLLKELDITDFPKIEAICAEIKSICGEYTTLNGLVNLFFNDKEAYNYAINSDILKSQFYNDSRNCLECSTDTWSIGTVKAVEQGYNAKTASNELITGFVSDSDSFNKKDELSEYISQFQIEDDIVAYRGDSDTGLFESISIENTPFSKKVRGIIIKNYLKTKKDMIKPNNGHYNKFFDNEMSLYEYIKSKKELTLADAMLVAKYGNEKFINEICELITSNSFVDNRFKSTSFSECFVDSWLRRERTKSTKVKSKLTIKNGCEGIYVASTNRQYEFVVNNKPKIIQYTNAIYNKKTNTFELVGSIIPQ